MSKRDRINDLLGGDEQKPETRAYQGLSDDVFAALDDEQVTENELAIMDVFADPTQPRRIMPQEIRGEWEGDPKTMPALLQTWNDEIARQHSPLPVERILKGEVEPSQYETGNRFVDDFLGLLNLAAQIRSIGLNQAIGVLPQGDGYQIIFGERRWTAFHLLNHFLDEDFSMIPAKVADVTPWEVAKMQASENYQREEPNAIAKARMFAKLLIIALSGDKNTKFDPPHALNAPDCDRPWYAQVANGDLYRIPRGMGGEFEQVLGISTDTMRKYRNLLKLTDDHEFNNAIWNLADEHDWAEGFQTEIGRYIYPAAITEALRLYRAGSHGIGVEEYLREAIAGAKARKEAEKDAATPPAPSQKTRPSWMEDAPTPSPSPTHQGGEQTYDARTDEGFPWKVADRVLTPQGVLCRIDEIHPDGSMVLQRLDDLKYIKFKAGVQLRPAEEVPPPAPPAAQGEGLPTEFAVGQWVTDDVQQKYRVMKQDGERVYVESAGGQRFWAQASSFTIADAPPSAGDPADRPYDESSGGLPPVGARVQTHYGRGEVIGYDDGGSIHVQFPPNTIPQKGTNNRLFLSPSQVSVVDDADVPPSGSPRSAGGDGGSDKGHSAGGGNVFATRPETALETLALLVPSARRYDDEAAVVLSALTRLDEGTLRQLAAMSAEDADALLVGYETRIAALLERLMQQFEEYTRWVREQAEALREEGGA